MTICTQHSALSNLCHDGSERVASTLDHVRGMHDLASLGAVLGSRVDMIELQRGGMRIESADLASTRNLDTVGDRSGRALICSHR